MATKTSGVPPDKWRKYDEALRLASESRSTQAAARQLGISPKLLYRWQQAEVGSVEVTRDQKYGPCVQPMNGWRRNSTF